MEQAFAPAVIHGLSIQNLVVCMDALMRSAQLLEQKMKTSNKSISIKEASEIFEQSVSRRLEKRKLLCQNAINAAARLMESQGSVPSRFPELAPLTKAERLIVASAVKAGSTGSSNGVD